ncbi:hypothetical protein LEP1GSC042_0140, partial [Leptospira kirschneri serovar Bim str. PUO 1247]
MKQFYEFSLWNFSTTLFIQKQFKSRAKYPTSSLHLSKIFLDILSQKIKSILEFIPKSVE